MRNLTIAILLFLSACGQTGLAPAASLADAGMTSHFTLSGASAKIKSVIEFCERSPEICKQKPSVELPATDELITLIDEVNRSVNASMKSTTDMKQYGVSDLWAMPAANAGDCEDFVLEKRRRLIDLGVSTGAMRVVTLFIPARKEYHAVLAVMTDRGPFMLDNMREMLLTPFSKAGYLYQSIQSNDFVTFDLINGVRM